MARRTCSTFPTAQHHYTGNIAPARGAIWGICLRKPLTPKRPAGIFQLTATAWLVGTADDVLCRIGSWLAARDRNRGLRRFGRGADPTRRRYGRPSQSVGAALPQNSDECLWARSDPTPSRRT